MIITEEISIYNFEPWSGAVLTYDILFNNNKLDEFEQYIEDCYPEGIDKGHLNDLLWHDAKGVLEQFGCIKSEEELEDFVAENCQKNDPENGQKIILSYEEFYAIFEDDFNVYEWDIIRPNYQNWVENLVDIDI